MWCNHAEFTKGCKSCEESRTTKEQEIELIDAMIRKIYDEAGIVGIARMFYERGFRA